MEEATTASPALPCPSLDSVSSRTLSPASRVASYPTVITASLRSKIRALRNHAEWTFRRIAQEVGVDISHVTVVSICSAPAIPRKTKVGRPKVLIIPIPKRLVDFATASQKNSHLPYTEVAELAGVSADLRNPSYRICS